MDDKARYTAVQTLYDIEVKKSFSNLKLNHYFQKFQLEPLDRSFASEIVYGTIRWKLRLDYLISKYLKTRIEKMSPWILCCLRSAVYQIYFMDKVPEFAAVNQAVEIAKTREPKGAAFVNAVLRNILRNKQEFYNINIKNKNEKYAIEYSHPQWLVEKFSRDLGEDFAIELMKKNNTPPAFIVRINTLKCTKNELRDRLEKKGIEVTETAIDEALVLKGYGMIEKSEEFNSGFFTIQDESSMMAVKILDPKPGERILDMCSAPGGKATHMAQLMGNTGEIHSFDIYKHKLDLIKSNAGRLGIKIIRTMEKDSTVYDDSFKNYADRVLVDAPCSGLGLIRKKPEIRWSLDLKEIGELQRMQKTILANASSYVKREGILVYSTCTLTHEENEDVIEDFLSNHPEYSRESICSYIPEKFQDTTCSSGYIRLYPNIHGTDGFFIARMKRNG